MCGFIAVLSLPTDPGLVPVFQGNDRAVVTYGIAWIGFTVAGFGVAASISKRPRPLLATALATGVYALFAVFGALAWAGLVAIGIAGGFLVAVLYRTPAAPSVAYGHQV